MNERIKELAKDAGYYLYDLTETHECKTVETDSTDEWITLEKFAELMIQEFETVAKNPRWYFPDQQDGWRDPINCVCKEMKKHFGVKA